MIYQLLLQVLLNSLKKYDFYILIKLKYEFGKYGARAGKYFAMQSFSEQIPKICGWCLRCF